jgi:hypothetical protein
VVAGIELEDEDVVDLVPCPDYAIKTKPGEEIQG